MTKLPTLANVSLIGNKHISRGTPCEDASISKTANGVSVVCVADGAGGAKYTHARFGAKCAVETVSELLCKHFDAFYFENRESISRSLLVTAIHSHMADLLVEHELDGLERLSCTLLFVAVKGNMVLAGHIGDGLICRVSSHGISPLTLPQNGENASSTYFITFPNAQEYLRFFRTTTDDTHAFVLMTDGVEDMVYDSSSQLVRPVVARLAELASEGKTEAEDKLTKILQEFVVGAGQNTDDASVGIVYLNDTVAPDSASLPDSKENIERDFNDSIKTVQMELLPQVKHAQEILTSIRCKNEEDSDKVDSSEEQEPSSESSQEPNHTSETAATTEPSEESSGEGSSEKSPEPDGKDLVPMKKDTQKVVPLWAFLLVSCGFIALAVAWILAML